jgi:sortase A
MSFHPSKLKPLERVLFIAGAALLGYAVITYAGGRLYSTWAVARFHAVWGAQSVAGAGESKSDNGVDFSLWAPKRIEAYKATLAEHFDNPLAVLKVDKIHLEVPVFEGTDEPILNRGAGRIIGTARIGDSGNVGIAAHRDGFFRGLKDVYVGDSLELETAHGTQTYAIDWIKVVDKDDVSVLRQEPASTLTLVTCYPFYFVGSAPQRYIVHASLKSETKTLNEPVRASSQATASRTKENTQ